MFKKKRVVLSVFLIVFLAALATGVSWVYVHRKKKAPVTTKPSSDVKVVATVSQNDILKNASKASPNSSIPATAATIATQQKIDNKDYTGAIAQSKAAYSDPHASIPTRVYALSQCITAARAIGDTATQNDCKTKADQLIASIPASTPQDVKDYSTFLIKLALGEAKPSDYGGDDANH